MFRQIPVQNKICFQREHERKIQMHEIKIKNMKKMIDNESPQQYDFLVSRKKKEALQQSRGNEIQRENKILIHKLTSIMNRNSLPHSQTQQNFNQAQGSAFSSSMYSNMFPNSAKNSLNQVLRKKEFVKIVIENQALLKRIQGQKSEYNVRAWEKERQKNERYISQISEYQYKDFKPNKTIVKMGIWKDNQNSQQLTKKPSGKLQPLFKNKNQSRIIYKNGKKIGSFIYLVEIKVQAGFFIINLENLQKQPNQYKIELPEDEGMNILINECNNDPELVIERIRIDEKTKSFYFKKNFEYKAKGDSLNNSQEEHSNNQNNQQHPHQNNGLGHNNNHQENENSNQLRVTEEKEEEEEQSILKSKVNEHTAHKQTHDSHQQQHHEAQHTDNHENNEQAEQQEEDQKEEKGEEEEQQEDEENNEYEDEDQQNEQD